MLGNHSRPRIPLPKQWPKRVRSGVLHTISLAHFSLTFTRSWAANGINARIRLKAENDRLRQELHGARRPHGRRGGRRVAAADWGEVEVS